MKNLVSLRGRLATRVLSSHKLVPCLVLAGSLLTAAVLQAQNVTYTTTQNGTLTWSGATWTNTPGAQGPSGAGNTAALNYLGTGNTTMTLDNSVTIGTISAPSGNQNNIITGNNTFTMNGTGGTNVWGVANEAGIGTGANSSGGNLTLQSGVGIIMATNLSVGNTNGGVDLTISGNITNTSGGALNLNLRNNNTGNAGTAPGHLLTIGGTIGASGSQINIQNLSAQAVASSTSNVTLSGAIGGASGATVTVTNAATTSIGDFTISGRLGESVTTVTQSSYGSRLILSNATNAYTGQTTISAGVLQASDGVGLTSASFLSLDGGVLQSNGASNFTRSLGTSGASTFQFTANGGGFSANGGQLTVNIGGGSALQWGNTVGTNIVGNLRFGSVTANNKTLFQNAIDLNGQDRTILVTAGTGADSTEISGAVTSSSGTAGLNVIGNGLLILSNASNTFNGSVSITGGAGLVLTSVGGSGRTITVGANSLVGSGSAIDNAFLGRIVQSSNPFTIGLGASSSNNLDLTGFTNVGLAATANSTYTGTLTPNGQSYRVGGGTAVLTLNTILANNGGATSLTKTGLDTVVLAGSNTYTGNTTVNSGTLSLTGSLDSTSNLVINGGVFSYDKAGTNSQTVAGTILNAGGIINNTVAGDTLNLGAITRNSGGAVNFATTTGAIRTTSGNTNGILGPWATIGSGTSQRYAVGSTDNSTLTTITAYTSGTNATAGTLANLTAGGNFEYSAAATTTANLTAYTLRYTGGATSTTIGAGLSLTLNGILNSGTGVLTVAAGNATTSFLNTPTGGDLVINSGNTTQGVTVSAPIGGSGSVTKAGSGTLTLSSGSSNYSGGLNLSQGTIIFGGNTAASGGVVTTGPTGSGTFTIGHNTNIGWTTGLGIGANSIVLVGDANFVGTSNRLSFGGPFVLGSQTHTWYMPGSSSAASSVALAGTGNLGVRFSQVSGGPAVSVDSGNLRLVGSSPWAGIGFFNVVTFNNNAGFTLGNNMITSFSSTNQLGAAGTTSASLTVEGGGYLNLSNGTSSVSQSVNSLAGAGTVTNLSTTAGNATLTVGNASGTNDSTTFSGQIVNGSVLNTVTGINANGVVALTKNGTGTLTLSGTNNYTGATTINGGSIQFAKTASLYNANEANWTRSLITVNSGGTLGLNVGGTNQFTSANVTTLLTNLGGNVTSGGLKSGSRLALDTTNATGATFTVNDSIANTTGTGGGAIGLSKLGTGTLILNGSNSYTGNTVITAGVLQLGNGGTTGSLSASSTILNNGGLVINRSNSVVQGTDFSSASITGNGSFTQAGAGSTTLNVSNSFSGGTIVSVGTLIASNSNALGTGSVTVSSGAALNTGVASLSTGTFSSGGNFTLNGSSAGAVALATGANLTLTGGTWFFSSGDQFIGSNTSVFAISGVTLDLTGVGEGTYVLATGFNPGGANSATFSTYANLGPNLALGGLDNTGGVLTLSVLPEPSTYALGAFGLLGLAALQRLRRRRVDM